MAITFTQEQEDALGIFSAFLRDPNENFMIIHGAAGSGKSTLIEYLIKAVEAQKKMYALLLRKQVDKSEFEVMLSATTNQAAAVLKKITGMDARTVHSIMKLTVTYHPKTGKPCIKKKRDYKKLYNKLLIIDEASMINDELFEIIKETAASSKVVMIGDQYQLAPVQQNHSIMETLQCTRATMNQVMRNQGNIMHAGAAYRETVETGIFKPIMKTPEIIHADGPTFQKRIDQAFLDPNYTTSKAKVLTWTNDRVHEYNAHIRGILGYPDVFTVGEDVITNNPIMLGSYHWSVDSIVTITEVGDLQLINGVPGRMIQINNKASSFTPDNPTIYKNYMNTLANANKWAEYYAIKETWFDLRPTYSSTVHKAQGGEYDTIFIDLEDIGRCNTPSDVARMMYVSISRSKKQVVLYGSLPAKYC